MTITHASCRGWTTAKPLEAAGFTTVYCTPHLIRHRYEASNAEVRQSVKKLQTALDRRGIALRLLAAREYFMDNHFHEYLNDPMPLEGTRYLLIEIPSDSHEEMVLEIITSIRRKGLTPMIAHPERCQMLTSYRNHKIPKSLGFFRRNTILGRLELEYSYQHRELLDWLSGFECGFHGNAGSFAGMYGRPIQERANHFWQQSIYTHYGTDAHSPEFFVKLASKIRNNKSLDSLYPHHKSGQIQTALAYQN